MPPDLPISEDDWQRTPASVQAVVVALWQQVEALQAQAEALRAEVARLQERVGRTSQNSSQPPSSDAPSAPARPKQPPSGRSAGGQKGHTGHGRTLKSVEDVQHVALERQALGFLGEIAGPDAGRLWTRQRETSLPEDIVQGWTSAAREQQNVLTLIAWVREKIRRRCRALTLRRAVFGAARLLTVAGGRSDDHFAVIRTQLLPV